VLISKEEKKKSQPRQSTFSFHWELISLNIEFIELSSVFEPNNIGKDIPKPVPPTSPASSTFQERDGFVLHPSPDLLSP